MSKFSSIKPLYNKNNKPYSKSDQYFSTPISLSSSQEEYQVCRTISEEPFSFKELGNVVKTGDTFSIAKPSPKNDPEKSHPSMDKTRSSEIITKKIPNCLEQQQQARSLPLNKNLPPDQSRKLVITRSLDEEPQQNEHNDVRLLSFNFHSTGNQNSDNAPTAELTGDLSATDVSSFGE